MVQDKKAIHCQKCLLSSKVACLWKEQRNKLLIRSMFSPVPSPLFGTDRSGFGFTGARPIISLWSPGGKEIGKATTYYSKQLFPQNQFIKATQQANAQHSTGLCSSTDQWECNNPQTSGRTAGVNAGTGQKRKSTLHRLRKRASQNTWDSRVGLEQILLAGT